MGERSHFRLELPLRKENEEDITERQKQYIEHLLEEIEAENFNLNIAELGKWQACSLISHLIDVKDGKESGKPI